ncbi:hypothetical protein PC120_g23908 [Phytophthora cactorum]|nr:hypothetical protein PC120_g23908 [Phytophthora cactorum]
MYIGAEYSSYQGINSCMDMIFMVASYMAGITDAASAGDENGMRTRKPGHADPDAERIAVIVPEKYQDLLYLRKHDVFCLNHASRPLHKIPSLIGEPAALNDPKTDAVVLAVIANPVPTAINKDQAEFKRAAVEDEDEEDPEVLHIAGKDEDREADETVKSKMEVKKSRKRRRRA